MAQGRLNQLPTVGQTKRRLKKMIEPLDQAAIGKQIEAQHANQVSLNHPVHEYNSWTRFVLDRTDH
jgi:hypothetical protein